MWSNEAEKEYNRTHAKVELTKLQAAKVLITNNDLGAEINVAGVVVGISVNERLLPVIEAEIDEIEKYLAGQPNNYE